MTRRHHTTGRRAGGFTITELLVALALIIFILSIMGTAFGAASKVVRDLNAAGSLAAKLNSTLGLWKRDLDSPHFDNPPRRLGDATFWSQMGPNSQGFLRIVQLGRPLVDPPGDPPAVDAVTTMTTAALHFTAKLPGTYPGDYFITQLPAGHAVLTSDTATQRESRYQSAIATNQEYRSVWAEIGWWLIPTPLPYNTTPDDATMPTVAAQQPQALFKLCRRTKLLWNYPQNWPTNAPSVGNATDAFELSVPSVGFPGAPLNTPFSVTFPPLRSFATTFDPKYLTPNGTTLPHDAAASGTNATKVYPGSYGLPPLTTDVSDVVLNDVLSMDIRVKIDGVPDFIDIGSPLFQQFNMGNPAYPSSPPAGTPYVFDTWTNGRLGQFDYGLPDDAAAPDLTPRWQRRGSNACVPVLQKADGTLIRVRALQITLRIWDAKTNYSRQATLVVDMGR